MNEEKHKITIEFDGGTPCNIPSKGFGIGYGSYSINGGKPIRVNHGIPCSNNCAEILTVAVAFLDVVSRFNPAETSVLVKGDSQIALKWVDVEACNRFVKKGPKGTTEFLNAITQLREAVRGFHSIKTEWQPREKSVKTFGH